MPGTCSITVVNLTYTCLITIVNFTCFFCKVAEYPWMAGGLYTIHRHRGPETTRPGDHWSNGAMKHSHNQSKQKDCQVGATRERWRRGAELWGEGEV